MVYGTIRFMGVRAKDTAGAAGGVIPSDLFLVVIHRFKNCGRILNRRGDFVQRSSICDSWFAFGFRICVPGVGVVDLGFVP